ncbi:MAG: hypothetical protein IJ161_03790 [Bacteroidales bacterium]|nr:hypothetical protein [Bacteroidales bacterium]
MRFIDYILVLLFYCFALSSCTKHAKQQEIPIFLYKDLQDSVQKYVKSTQPIENTLNLPTFTQVIIDYIDGDTLIIARPALDPYTNDRDSVIGANYLEGRICEVIYGVYGSFKHLPGLVNEKELIIPQKDYDAHSKLPPNITIGEDFYFEILKKGTMNRVWVLNRPCPLKLIVINGKRSSE